MVLINDILIALVMSAAFPLGHLLYLWSKEEVDWVLGRYKLLKNSEKIILPVAIVSGLLAGFFMKNTAILLVLFLANLIVASLGIKENKQILFPTILFMISFLILYLIRNFLRPI